jgi:hypothetical protein
VVRPQDVEHELTRNDTDEALSAKALPRGQWR